MKTFVLSFLNIPKLISAIILFSMINKDMCAQNLVPNPGFESFTTCPIGFSEFDGYVSDWTNPNTGTPDYMNACANPYPAGVPQNGVGFQQTHGGNAYAGCYFDGGGFYTEYVQAALTQPLTAGVSYAFNMYVVLHNKSETATDDIGAYFSVTAPTSSGLGYLNGNPLPQIFNTPGNAITDTLDWQLISGTYVASGGEQYITIGHFRNDSDVTYINLPYGNLGPYYYIDDVSLEPEQGAAFVASNTDFCEKFCVDFTDQSVNNPMAWQWTFPGGSPATSTDQNPSNICYNVPGTYDVTLITTISGDHDTITLPGYITVHATPAVPLITQTGLVLTSSPAPSYQWQFNTVDIFGATDQSYTVTQSGLYTVVVSDSNGCVSTADIKVLISGIDDNHAENISVSITGENLVIITFGANNGADKISYQVLNEMGQEVIRQEGLSLRSGSLTISLKGLPPGIYFLAIDMGQEKIIKKIPINN